MIRSNLFQIAYWATSVFFAIGAAPFLLIPSRKPLMVWIFGYTRVMVFWLRWIVGVRIVIRGRERLPHGPCVIAAKHQSWGDGVVMFSQFFDLAFVTGDHLEKFPLLGRILRKMGAIVVDNCGGAYARACLISREMKRARSENRRILIYPEGRLSPVGEKHHYRKGVYHMYAAYDCPAVPVATNLGLCWPPVGEGRQQENAPAPRRAEHAFARLRAREQSWRLTPGEAVVEFLDPIAPGLDKETFMKWLEEAIETRSRELAGLAPAQPADGPLIAQAKTERA
ncbi:MAG: lysophospholipid acyltransferase family protein [Parvularculaceae bacterium]